ncbi:MAG: arginine--tRNA ligase, partial [Armatimonadetes bacterium]|nr:arginine--tRNA ligase [Armatimonadota bacterium]
MAQSTIVELLAAAVEAATAAGALPSGDVSIKIEQPPNPELGDFSTNLAMMLAKPAGKPPREVAQII